MQGTAMKGLLPTLLFSAAMLILPAHQAQAETLNEALASAYSGNPTIRAERARQRGTDEKVPQALSGWRPRVTAEAELSHNWTFTDTVGNDETRESDELDLFIGLSQPLFRGFKTVEGTKQAESTVEAGRYNLLAVE